VYADCRFFVYDAEMGTFIEHNMGDEYLPLEPFCDRHDKRLIGVMAQIQKHVPGKENNDVDHTQPIQFSPSKLPNQENENEEEELEQKGNLKFFTYFCTTEQGIKQ